MNEWHHLGLSIPVQFHKFIIVMWFLIALLVVLWLIGLISFGAAAYWVHILLVVAIVLFILNLLRGRSAPPV
jgi:hypothetical protein